MLDQAAAAGAPYAVEEGEKEGEQGGYQERMSRVMGEGGNGGGEEMDAAEAEARAMGDFSDEGALRAFAESVGMSVDAMWDGVEGNEETRCGEIAEIFWSNTDLEGTLPVGDMHMPHLCNLDLSDNKALKGEVWSVDSTKYYVY